MGVAELGRSDRERAVESHHKLPLYGGNRLDGLGLAVLTQHPLEQPKDADHRHHQGYLRIQHRNKVAGLRAIGEHLIPPRGVGHR
jgi:hypothetical protein